VPLGDDFDGSTTCSSDIPARLRTPFWPHQLLSKATDNVRRPLAAPLPTRSGGAAGGRSIRRGSRTRRTSPFIHATLVTGQKRRGNFQTLAQGAARISDLETRA
jgi:hypothetical protein